MTFGVINGNNQQIQQWNQSAESTIENSLADRRKELIEYYGQKKARLLGLKVNIFVNILPSSQDGFSLFFLLFLDAFPLTNNPALVF